MFFQILAQYGITSVFFKTIDWHRLVQGFQVGIFQHLYKVQFYHLHWFTTLSLITCWTLLHH